MASPSIHRIERLNYGLSAIAVIIAALTQPRPVALGLAVGAGLTCLNFFVLRRLVVKWTNDAALGKQMGNSQILILPKMIGLIAAVALAILLLPIDPIAFVIGYSIFLVSIVIDTIYSAMRPNDEAAPKSKEHDHG